MKKSAIQYLAFDVHQATTVACLRNQTGRVIMEATVPTEATALVRLVRNAGRRVHVAFEEGTQAQWLHDLLVPHAERVIVCNTRGERRSGNKNDRLDASKLSERLRCGDLRPVFHRGSDVLTLKELVRSYNNLVEDTTRVMQRIKALFRARAIATKGRGVYRAADRAEIIAIMRTPWHFRTKRNLWPYAGLAVVTWSSADQEFAAGRLRKRKRPALTRGLNQNHNSILKDVFKAAATAGASQPGPLRDYYEASIARGVNPDLAKLTLARKIASVTLRLWKKGELWDPNKLTMQAT